MGEHNSTFPVVLSPRNVIGACFICERQACNEFGYVVPHG